MNSVLVQFTLRHQRATDWPLDVIHYVYVNPRPAYGELDDEYMIKKVIKYAQDLIETNKGKYWSTEIVENSIKRVPTI